jgi:CheY-like chemotaxis protein
VRRKEEFQAKRPIEPAPAERSVLLGIADTKLAGTLAETIRAEGIHTTFVSSMEKARTLIAKDRPSIAILEHDPPYIDGLEMCRVIREQENDHQHQLPVVMVAAQESHAPCAAAGVTDWLIRPFTDAYARTKICVWLLRTACQRSRVVVSEDEKRHLAGPLVRVRRGPVALSKNVIGTDKSALLWMYCREIAPFETPAFSKAIGDLIVRATKRSQKCATVRVQI